MIASRNLSHKLRIIDKLLRSTIKVSQTRLPFRHEVLLIVWDESFETFEFLTLPQAIQHVDHVLSLYLNHLVGWSFTRLFDKRHWDRSLLLFIWNCLYSLFTVLMKLNIILILTRLYDTFHQRGRGHEVTVTPLHVSCHVRVTVARYPQVRRGAVTPPVELET